MLSPSARTTSAESSQGAGEHAECPAAAADGVEVATGLPETRPVRLDDMRTVIGIARTRIYYDTARAHRALFDYLL